FFQAEDGIRDRNVTGVQTCALPISKRSYEYESMIADKSMEEPVPDVPLVESDHICYLYTGGTTGLPKAAVRSHRSMYMVGLLFSIEFSISRNGKGLAA